VLQHVTYILILEESVYSIQIIGSQRVFPSILNKKTPAVGRGSIVYFKNLKLCNSVLCGIFPHHTTHIANHKIHFLVVI
jgi:hypothetical protein